MRTPPPTDHRLPSTAGATAPGATAPGATVRGATAPAATVVATTATTATPAPAVAAPASAAAGGAWTVGLLAACGIIIAAVAWIACLMLAPTGRSPAATLLSVLSLATAALAACAAVRSARRGDAARRRAEAAERDADAARRDADAARRDAEDRLQQATESAARAARASGDAAEANRAKSEFLANMSHEIRTPLTAILGYADILFDPDPTTEDRLEYIRTIRRNGEHLLALINDTLDLSKIEAGRLEVECAECRPSQVVSDVVSALRVRSADKGVALEVSCTGPLPSTIRTDPTRLRQILINLVGNAIKFTESGSVRLVVGMEPAAPAPAPAASNAETNTPGEPRLRVDVVDTGVGMSEDQVRQIFQPFTQVDSSMRRRIGGTGLGLMISKKLAQLLGGDIAVQSTPGVGSRFTLTVRTGCLDGVPLVRAAPEPRTNGAASPAGGAMVRPSHAAGQRATPGKIDGRILLVEDGVHNRQVVRFYLNKGGATVECAENGRIACETVRAAEAAGRPYDLILMDMQMPEMDGYTATAWLREHGCRTPIIAITAHAMSHDRAKCIEAGCNDYIAKPFERDALLRTVAAHLAPSQSSGPIAAGRPSAEPTPAATRQQAPRQTPQQAPQPPATAAASSFPPVPPAAAPAVSDGPIRSTSTDPDLAAFMPAFIADLPVKVSRLIDVAAKQDAAALRRVAHELKGTSGFYGFASLGETAGRIERMIDASAAGGAATAAIENVAAQVESLVALIRRVEGYDRSKEVAAAAAPGRAQAASAAAAPASAGRAASAGA
jgi:signal transduction histidine kinase/CheY-like chemotaxis protein/HPt (histidine-containing phosphotransfer) domain-containing protein